MTGNNYGLKGRRAIVTGASRGLGRVCAEALAREGVDLLLASRSEGDLQRLASTLDSPERHAVYVGDLTREDEISGLVERALRFGDIDIVLHVMGGGLGMRDPLLTWQEMDTLLKTNLSSAAEINRQILPGMIERETGNIVHVGSIASSEAVGSVGYNTAKAGLAAYSRSLGREVAKSGVIVTAILPGGFWAPENSFERFRERDPELLAKLIAEKQPRGKMGDADEILPLIFFLVSRQATMMAGCCVPIDGGEGVAYL